MLTLQIIPVDGDELATAITKTIASVDLNECDRYSCHTNAACENSVGNFCYTCNVGFTDEDSSTNSLLKPTTVVKKWNLQ